MTRTAPSRKEATHQRIVDAASRAIRRSGYGGTGVADIMKDGGLTHGGFYAPFDSREAMLAGIAAAVPGAYIDDISTAIEAVALPGGYGRVRQSAGHATGTAVAQAPQVPHPRTRRPRAPTPHSTERNRRAGQRGGHR